MLLFKKEKDLKHYISAQRNAAKTIGFAPTMGALHAGHISLIERAKSQCDIVVCSIFVNPTQFNDPKDLEKYPRTEVADIQLLTSANCDVLFMPEAKEVYPKGKDWSINFEFGDLTKVMEGVFRPGHFDGMAQVVKRLLDMVNPHRLYMGQKDFQQFSIVQNMLVQMGGEIQIVMCETMREADGLAMSSRNTRLSSTLRKHAHFIYKALSDAKMMMGTHSPNEIEAWGKNELQIPNFRPEYFDIVDGRTLQPLQSFTDSDFIVCCVATWLGEVRLIDNIILKAPQNLY
jgi:pantoate--beta-alanine ligase